MRMADFLEDPNGDGSMVRLLAIILALCVLGIVVTTCILALKNPEGATSVIGAFTALVIPLVGGVWANIRERVRTDDSTST